jgi:putative transposase
MQLSPPGEIAHRFLAEIPRHFPHAEVDEFVVMPDHVHVILVLRAPPHSVQQRPKRTFGPLAPGSLSKIIQAYKASVTRQARLDGHSGFAWQERFYDHIVRDEKSPGRIRACIAGNPARWGADEPIPGR